MAERKFRDHCSERGARRLAEQIEKYWMLRNHRIKAWVTIVDETSGSEQPIYAVRSNLVNGLPPAMTQIKHHNKLVHHV